jgi:hypothetical protein
VSISSQRIEASSALLRIIFRSAYIQGDQKVSVHLTITVQKPRAIDDLKMAITEYIRNVDRAVLNTVF